AVGVDLYVTACGAREAKRYRAVGEVRGHGATSLPGRTLRATEAAPRALETAAAAPVRIRTCTYQSQRRRAPAALQRRSAGTGVIVRTGRRPVRQRNAVI